MAGKLLLLDEARELVELLTVSLTKAGYEVVSAYDPDRAAELLRRERPDAVIIDSNLGRWDGLEVVKQFRPRTRVPLILLTGSSSEHERAVCKALGADDCLAKPFSQRDLISLVQLHLNRAAERDRGVKRVIEAGDFVLDLGHNVVSWSGRRVHVSAIECRLLEALLSPAGRTVDAPSLALQIWPQAGGGAAALIRAAVRRLWQKLEHDPEHPRLLLETSDGYLFKPELLSLPLPQAT